MISKRKAGIVLTVILTLSMFLPLMSVEGAVESQNISIVDTINDGFVTEVGNWFYESGSVSILDPNMDITAYLVFRDLEINRWEYLENATLRLYAPGLLPADLDSSVTIRGVDIHNFLGFENGGQVSSAPKTSAFYNVNTSAFTGGFQYIDVTEIVRELIGTVTWTGDGHSGTDSKDNMGFIILGDGGSDARYFYDFGLGNGLGPRLTLFWGDEAAPPPATPPSDPDPEFNETDRGITIWIEPDPNLGENRTGGVPSNYTAGPTGIHINWNTLDQTLLTEHDSAANIFPQNSTWVQTLTFTKSATGSLYNDTGAPANITSFFIRFQVNVTDVNLIDHSNVPGLTGLATAAQTTSAGYPYGVTGEYIGLWIQADADDTRWKVQAMDRDGVSSQPGASSTWFNENDVMLYFEVAIHIAQSNNYITYNIFNDPQFRDLNQTRAMNISRADGPMRYAHIAPAIAQAGSSHSSLNFYTYLTAVDLGGNETWCLTWPNGTIVDGGCNFDSYDDAKQFIDDLLGSDPADPNPPGQGWPEEGQFTRFRTRFYILLIGVFLIFGPLMTFAFNRPSGYEFTIGMFIMLIGFSLMLAAGSV